MNVSLLRLARYVVVFLAVAGRSGGGSSSGTRVFEGELTRGANGSVAFPPSSRLRKQRAHAWSIHP